MLERVKQLQAVSQYCTDRGDAGRDDMEVREGRVWMRESQDETERLMRRGEDGGCLDTEEWVKARLVASLARGAHEKLKGRCWQE